MQRGGGRHQGRHSSHCDTRIGSRLGAGIGWRIRGECRLPIACSLCLSAIRTGKLYQGLRQPGNRGCGVSSMHMHSTKSLAQLIGAHTHTHICSHMRTHARARTRDNGRTLASACAAVRELNSRESARTCSAAAALHTCMRAHACMRACVGAWVHARVFRRIQACVSMHV